MEEYIFENVLNCNIQIRIEANYYLQAVDLLSTAIKYPEDYKLIN